MVIPVLVYPDVRAAVAWLTDVFGFVERVGVGENHRSQLQIGVDGAVIVADTSGEQQPPQSGAVTHLLKVRVADVDGQCERARSSGARVLQEPTDHEYGERECTVEDLAGHRWQFTQTMRDVAPQEWGGTGTGWHVRVYIPATRGLAGDWRKDGQINTRYGYAVTPAARKAHYYTKDEDALERIAIKEAAYFSLRYLFATQPGVPERIVLAVDLPAHAVQPSPHIQAASQVYLSDPVPLSALTGVYLDEPDAAADVTAAMNAIPEYDLGSSAGVDVGRADGHRLRRWPPEMLAAFG